MRHHLIRAAILAVLVVVTSATLPHAAAQQQPPWTVVELQPLPGAEDAVVHDVNNGGYAVGQSGGRPVIWSPSGVPTELPLGTGFTTGVANAITEWGLVAGTRGPSGGGGPLAATITAWFNGTRIPIGGTGVVNDVSESGAIVGTTVAAGELRPYIRPLSGNVQFLLPTASGAGAANAVNRNNVTVGIDGGPGEPTMKAVRWANFRDTYLVPGYPGQSIGVDVIGVGYSLADLVVPTPAPAYRVTVVVAPGGAVTQLGPVPRTQGVDMNEIGVVVGTEDPDDAAVRGVLFIYGARVNLTSLVSADDAAEWGLDAPVALNDNFWVVGNTGDAAWLLRPPA